MHLARYTPILIALSVTALDSLAQEPPTIPSGSIRVQTFGMVGVSTGQNVRLNVLNPGILTPSNSPIACAVHLLFVSDQGTVLKRAAAIVVPGRSSSLDINRDTDVSASQNRVEIRAVVTTFPLTAASSPPASPESLFCPLVPTLEVFDHDTGRTAVILTNPRVFISLPGIVGGGFFQN